MATFEWRCEGETALGRCVHPAKYRVSAGPAEKIACGLHMPQLVKWFLADELVPWVPVARL